MNADDILNDTIKLLDARLKRWEAYKERAKEEGNKEDLDRYHQYLAEAVGIRFYVMDLITRSNFTPNTENQVILDSFKKDFKEFYDEEVQ